MTHHIEVRVFAEGGHVICDKVYIRTDNNAWGHVCGLINEYAPEYAGRRLSAGGIDQPLWERYVERRPEHLAIYDT